MATFTTAVPVEATQIDGSGEPATPTDGATEADADGDTLGAGVDGVAEAVAGGLGGALVPGDWPAADWSEQLATSTITTDSATIAIGDRAIRTSGSCPAERTPTGGLVGLS